METRLIRNLLLLLACAYCISAIETGDEDVESITGTREPSEELLITTENSAVATTVKSSRESRLYRYGYNGRQDDGMTMNAPDHEIMDDDHDMDHEDPGEMREMTEAKLGGGGEWGGYYDFLINEGSYKFWAAFQLATAVLLTYSGFAALYYAKVNPTTTEDYDDYYLRRRRSVDQPPQEMTFLGLSPETFQRIIDAIAREFH